MCIRDSLYMKFGKDIFVSNPKKLLKINDLITDYIQQTKKTFRGLSSKSFESGYFRRASNCQSLTGAIPLLTHTGTLGC